MNSWSPGLGRHDPLGVHWAFGSGVWASILKVGQGLGLHSAFVRGFQFSSTNPTA